MIRIAHNFTGEANEQIITFVLATLKKSLYIFPPG